MPPLLMAWFWEKVLPYTFNRKIFDTKIPIFIEKKNYF